jgi:phosphoadenosine phosphosulfate reductase
MGNMANEPTPALLAELEEVNEKLEREAPSKAIEWAVDRFEGNLSMACSFQDLVALDLALEVMPNLEILFLETGASFPETVAFAEEQRLLRNLHLTVTHPGPEADAWPCGTENCCKLRKVAPLRNALDGRMAWLTSLKRVDAPTRAAIPIVGWDESFGLVKVNPLAAWTEDDIDSYIASHELPTHPLWSKGYRSIGCAPTTRPVEDGEDPRAGRWSGTGKVECGLHE